MGLFSSCMFLFLNLVLSELGFMNLVGLWVLVDMRLLFVFLFVMLFIDLKVVFLMVMFLFLILIFLV